MIYFERMHAKSLQSCLTLCNPMHCSPPGSSVHGILQAIVLKWVVVYSSRGSSWPRDQTHICCLFLYWQEDALPLVPPGKPVRYFVVVVVQLLSHVSFFQTPWTAACQASLSFTMSQSLLKLMFFESVIPSNHLVLCCALLPSIFPSIRVFSNELALRIRRPKYWSFSFSISTSNEYSGLISFRIDWFDLLAVQGVSRIFSNTTLQKHQFFSAQPSMQCYAKSLQLCPTLCDPIDGSPPGSSVPGSLQARTLEWVAISFSNAWKWKVKVKSLSRVRLLATPWIAA